MAGGTPRREWRADVVGVGAPIVTADRAVWAVNCGGPLFEISEERAMRDKASTMKEGG